MLDEQEYAEASRLYSECMKSAKEFRQKWGVPLDNVGIDERFRPIRQWYEQLTGFPNCHENAVMHHRLSLLGGPCRTCGKPLRTPRAKMCAACGTAGQKP
jgi:hypothetical protein